MTKILPRLWRKPGRGLGLPLLQLTDFTDLARGEREAVIRRLCINAYLGNGTALCRILGRYKIFVDTSDVGLSSHLLLDGYWEMWLTEVLASTVRPGMTAIDVGANLGYFSLLLADLVGPGGRVHAFEPNSRLAPLLRKSIAVNGFASRLTLHEQALGDAEGARFRLIVPDNEPKNGYMVPLAAEEADGTDTVLTRRLDGYAELLDVDVIKIDADTAEPAIWRGMAGILDRNRPLTIFLEFNVQRYADGRAFLEEILARGFRLSYVDLARGVLPCTPAQVLEDVSAEDWMLMLVR